MTNLNIKEAIKTAQQRFESISDSARLDAECILSFVLQKPLVYLRTWPEYKLDSVEINKFLSLSDRRAQGEPIAYILGCKQFWSLDLKVSKDTLIPRPETETLVEQAISITKQQDVNSILELGTGSGAIAIAVSSELLQMNQQSNIIATDISPQALNIAKQNATTHKQPIEFIESDWFNAIPSQQFDLIISNPPYIEQDDEHLTQGDVRFEPINALVSGDDGLTSIRTIIEQAKSWLRPNGWLILEHGYNQAEAIRQLFKNNGYSNIQTVHDLSKNDRISFAVSY